MSSVPANPNPRAASLDLAMIGNCTVSALIDSTAHLVWCCMPRFDSTPVFDALLQSANGVPEEGAITLSIDGLVRSEQTYDPGTAILRTRLWDAQGQCVEVVDFAPRFITRDRVFRPAQLVRRIRPLAGRPRIRLTVKPHGASSRRSRAAATTCAT
jgi:GH15 family glucan-1,4-alpha-glucosidase